MNKLENKNERWKALVFELKTLVEKSGLSQEEIAEKTGLLQSNVSRVLSAKYAPRLDILVKIANAIGEDVFIQKLEKK